MARYNVPLIQTILKIILLVPMLGLTQGCGGLQSTNPQKQTSDLNSLAPETLPIDEQIAYSLNEVIKVNEGDSVELTASGNELDQLGIAESEILEVSWIRMGGMDSQEEQLTSSDLTLKISSAALTDNGVYRLEINGLSRSLVKLIQLIVNKKDLETENILGNYSGYFLNKEGNREKFAELNAVTRQEALINCVAASQDNSWGILCLWKREIIFSREPEEPLGDFEGYRGSSESNMKRFARGTEFTRQEAIISCEANSIGYEFTRCTWRGVVVFEK